MTLEVDQYAELLASADDVWDVVGDPRQLSAWTGATTVGPPSRWEPGDEVRITGPQPVSWRVISVGQRGVEVAGNTTCGRLGLGVRIIPAGGGCRVVFAARLEPSRGPIRARVRDLPVLRRRFDRWSIALRRLVER